MRVIKRLHLYGPVSKPLTTWLGDPPPLNACLILDLYAIITNAAELQSVENTTLAH